MNLGEPPQQLSDPKLRTKLALNLFLLLTSVYLLTSSGNTVDVTDDAMLRYAVTESLIRERSFALRDEIGPRWGILGQDGRYYTKYGLGQSVLAIPFYLAGQRFGNPKFLISSIGPILSAFTCVLLFSLALRIGYSLKTATALGLIAGLCTQIWPEAKSPFDHHIETFFALLCVYQAMAFWQERRQWRLLLAGASLGLAVLTRVTSVLWFAPLVVLLYLSCRQETAGTSRYKAFLRVGGLFGLGLAPWLAVLIWYNAVRFGSIFETGYSLWAAQKGFANFGNSLAVGLAGELVSPGKGVLFYCPIFLLTLAGVRRFFLRQRELGAVLVLASILYLLFFAKYKVWHGDIAWGPRYLTVLMPYWVLFAEPFLRRQWLSRVVVSISFVFQLAAVMVDMNMHFARLLRSGVIHDVETYAYPTSLYFEVRHSPLLNRFAEIGQALNLIAGPRLEEVDRSGVPRAAPSVDFWWLRFSTEGTAPIVGWILACPFMLEAVASGYRIRRLLKQATQVEATLVLS